MRGTPSRRPRPSRRCAGSRPRVRVLASRRGGVRRDRPTGSSTAREPVCAAGGTRRTRARRRRCPTPAVRASRMVAVSVQVLDPVTSTRRGAAGVLVVAPDAAVHAGFGGVLNPLGARSVAAVNRGRMLEWVAHPLGAARHGLQVVSPVPASGVGPVDDDCQLPHLSLFGQGRCGSHRRSPAGLGRAVRAWLAAAAAAGVDAAEQLALCGAVLARDAARCPVHAAAPPDRLRPLPLRVHRRSPPVDLNGSGWVAGGPRRAQRRPVLVGEPRCG